MPDIVEPADNDCISPPAKKPSAWRKIRPSEHGSPVRDAIKVPTPYAGRVPIDGKLISRHFIAVFCGLRGAKSLNSGRVRRGRTRDEAIRLSEGWVRPKACAGMQTTSGIGQNLARPTLSSFCSATIRACPGQSALPPGRARRWRAEQIRHKLRLGFAPKNRSSCAAPTVPGS
jgi:hypothetical protein